MYTRERTVNALTKRFNENNWGPITVHSKAIDCDVTITPCLVPETLTPEYYLMHCDSLNLCGHDTLEEVADVLNSLEDIKRDSDLNRQALKEFYDAHLADKTDSQWDDMVKLQQFVIEDRFRNEGTEFASVKKLVDDLVNRHGFHDGLREWVKQLSKALPWMSKECVEAAIDLSEDWEYYSDAYKSEYGHRPRRDER